MPLLAFGWFGAVAFHAVLFWTGGCLRDFLFSPSILRAVCAGQWILGSPFLCAFRLDAVQACLIPVIAADGACAGPAARYGAFRAWFLPFYGIPAAAACLSCSSRRRDAATAPLNATFSLPRRCTTPHVCLPHFHLHVVLAVFPLPFAGRHWPVGAQGMNREYGALSLAARWFCYALPVERANGGRRLSRRGTLCLMRCRGKQ